MLMYMEKNPDTGDWLCFFKPHIPGQVYALDGKAHAKKFVARVNHALVTGELFLKDGKLKTKTGQ